MGVDDRRAMAWAIAACLVVAGCADDTARDDATATASTDATSTGGIGTTDRQPAVTTEAATAHSSASTMAGAPASTVDPSATRAATTPAPPTIDELLSRREPLSIAHQGGEHTSPSSTLFAYGEAIRAGADMLELDVHLSADGAIVVIHDDVVDDRTNGTGAVSEMAAAELAELDAAHWFVPGCGACPGRPPGAYPYRGVRLGRRPPPAGYTADDFGIPTLRQVVARYPAMPLDIEIKGGRAGHKTIAPLVAELQELGLTESVVVTSFEHDVVQAFRRRVPGIDVSPGQDGLLGWLAGEDTLDGYRIVQIPHVYDGSDILVPAILGRLRRDGFAVWVWIAEGAEQTVGLYRDVLDRGVDAILADRPARLGRALSAP